MNRPAAAIREANRSYPSYESMMCSEHPHCHKASFLRRFDSCDTDMARKLGSDGTPLYEKQGGRWIVVLV